MIRIKYVCFLVLLALYFLKAQTFPLFQAGIDWAVGSYPQLVCGADLDGDGDVNLAVANEDGNVSILMNLTIVDFISESVVKALPDVFALHQNSPNPFKDRTKIKFAIPKRCHVTLRLYDVSGKYVRTLINGELNPGYYTVIWDGRDDLNRRVSRGVYFMVLEAEDVKKTLKLLYME